MRNLNLFIVVGAKLCHEKSADLPGFVLCTRISHEDLAEIGDLSMASVADLIVPGFSSKYHKISAEYLQITLTSSRVTAIT